MGYMIHMLKCDKVIISSLPHGRSSAPKPSNLLYLEPFSSYVHMIPSLCRQSYPFLACPLVFYPPFFPL